MIENRIDELIEDYGRISVAELESKYNASYATIQRVLKRYNKIKGNANQIKYSYIREHEKEFILDWENGLLTKKELEEKYQCPFSTIYSRASELAIKRKTKTESIDLNQLVSDWKSYKFRALELAKKYHISYKTLIGLLENNIDNFEKRDGRKYFFDYKYFDVIDSEHKAYWLGLIYADGSHNPDRYTLRICLKDEDKELLKSFYKDIGCEREISYSYNKDYKKYYPNVCVQHPHLSQSLILNGLSKDKSFKIKFPSDLIVPKDLKRHFIRGYFDGDGGIYIPKEPIGCQKICYYITGNIEFMTGLKEFLLTNIKGYQDIQFRKSMTSNVYSLVRGGRFKAQEFLNWIYFDSTIYMQRKYDKYLQLLKYNKEKAN